MAIYVMAVIFREVQLTGGIKDKIDRHQPKRNTSEMGSFILRVKKEKYIR